MGVGNGKLAWYGQKIVNQHNKACDRRRREGLKLEVAVRAAVTERKHERTKAKIAERTKAMK